MARLESIEIKDLFGRKGFDHKIEFNQDPGMTIIVGANGFGKTTILKMINGLLSFDLSIFFSVPYTEVKFIFSPDIGLFDFIEFSRETDDSGKVTHNICFDKKKIKIDPINLAENIELANYLDELQYRDNFFSYSPQRRRPHIENKSLGSPYSYLYKLIEATSDQLESRYKRFLITMEQDDLYRILYNLNVISSAFPVHFISTDRLISRNEDREESSRHESSSKLMVVQNNEQLLQELEGTLAKATQTSQDLDNSFPYRMIKKINQNTGSVDFDNLMERLNGINKKRQELVEYGLLDDFSDPIDPESINNISVENQNFASMVLDEYIKDSEKKMQDLEKEAEKVRLLQSIIDKRFLFKKMRVNRKEGMQFLPLNQDHNAVDEKVIPLSSLSSGEQQELILFYKLLFQVSENSLVLIDEPELSLHVSWQKYFVEDVVEIANRNHFTVIIATHSPQIVTNHFDITTVLSGVE